MNDNGESYVRIKSFKMIKEYCPDFRLSCYGCPKEKNCTIPKKRL